MEDDYGNLRYIGANPNNYVLFNNELWRIIGVMKDVENPNGTKSDKIKLIRNENLKYSPWNNAKSSDETYGENNWKNSALQKMLNEGIYYNRTSGNCLYGEYGSRLDVDTCDFSNTGLTEEAKSMISESVWNLGDISGSTYDVPNTKDCYNSERGTDVYSGHPTTWTGRVGLIYPSDYGYATSGGSTTDRTTCLDTKLFEIYRLSDCYNNNWLNNNKWTMTSRKSFSGVVEIATNRMVMDSYILKNANNVYPTVYLNSELKILVGNDGSSTSPFRLK